MITAEARLVRIPSPLSRALQNAMQAVFSRTPRQLLILCRQSLVSDYSKIFRFRTLPAKATLVLPITVGSGFLKIGSTKNPNETNKFLQEVDELNANWKHEDEYSVLQSYLSEADESLENAELLWRLARASFHLAQIPTLGKSERRKLLEEALQHVHKSLQINDKDPNAHVWCSIIMGAEVMFRSIKEQVQSVGIIRKHLDRAFISQPEDALTRLTFAVWCYNIAKLSWMERQVAIIVQSSFPTSTWEEALEHFDKGEKASPDSIDCRHLLVGAQCCLHFGHNDRALSLLRRATDYAVRNIDDMKAHREAEALLRKVEKKK